MGWNFLGQSTVLVFQSSGIDDGGKNSLQNKCQLRSWTGDHLRSLHHEVHLLNSSLKYYVSKRNSYFGNWVCAHGNHSFSVFIHFQPKFQYVEAYSSYSRVIIFYTNWNKLYVIWKYWLFLVKEVFKMGSATELWNS